MQTSHEMVKQTQGALGRHREELLAAEASLEASEEQEAALLKEVSFHERQLDLAVAKVKSSGIKNLRGSARLDLRQARNQKILEKATFQALDGIVDAVSRLRKVNRGFADA